MLLAMGAPANFSKNSSRKTSKQTFLVAYQEPGADSGGDVGDTPPHQPFSTMRWINSFSVISNLFITMGANPWRDVSPPIIWQHPLQYFHVPKLGISEGDDLFLVFTSYWAKNWVSENVMTFFLVFTSL